ncbi:MAG: hypothetical protein CVU63_19570, partial [Deltaproteobacteria bacterium HGW-Deltaproteobacteria-20]
DAGVAGSAGGGIPEPYDAGVGQDAGDAKDEDPPLQGEAPDPFDAGKDVEPDVQSPGYAPGPWDDAGS